MTADSVGRSSPPPRKDGGKPVTGYVVEKREVGTDKWVKATPGTVERHAGHRSRPPERQGVRVPRRARQRGGRRREERAERAGEGGASARRAAHLHRVPAQREVNVRVGEPFKLSVPFTGGNPPPTPTITLNGVPHQTRTTSASLVVITPDNECILTNKCRPARGLRALRGAAEERQGLRLDANRRQRDGQAGCAGRSDPRERREARLVRPLLEPTNRTLSIIL